MNTCHGKKLSKKEIRLHNSPWITNSILNSIERRGKLLRKYIDTKDPVRKDLLPTEYKTVTELPMLSTRVRKIIFNTTWLKIVVISKKYGLVFKV